MAETPLPTRNGRCYLLRTCRPDGACYASKAGEFRWPTTVGAEVEAPDWDPNPELECGHGLHGLLFGVGDWSLLSREPDALWMVVSAEPCDVVASSGGAKHRFRRGRIEWVGRKVALYAEAWQLIDPTTVDGHPVRLSTATGDYAHAAATGDYAHAAATGDYAHAAATGDYAHAAATGHSGHAAATGHSAHAAATGYSGHAAATGDSGHAAATGYSGHAAATGYSGHAAATGDYAHAAATGYSAHAAATGDYAHAAATGDSGHAAATGYSGHAAATGDYAHAAATGYSGHAACLGLAGRAKCGPDGLVALAWYDSASGRTRMAIGYAGEGGIEPGVWYRANDRGELVRDAAQ